MEIRKDYPGGNIQVNRIEGNDIYLEQEIRDTGEWWFYWNFCACGMQGKTVTFHFENGEVVGKYGACRSIDRIHWEWTGEKSVSDACTFTYSFASGEDEVYFALSIPYQLADLRRFVDSRAAGEIEEDVLTYSEKGRPIPVLRIGNPDAERHLYFTCRHHACESTASFVLEGVMRWLLEREQSGRQLLCTHFSLCGSGWGGGRRSGEV